MKKSLDDMTATEDAIKKIVASMSNWQRNKWARAGYPATLDEVMKFKEMKRG
jgi:hypothetical protein